MKTIINHLIVCISVFILNAFCITGISLAQQESNSSGAVFPQILNIENVTLNGIPYSLSCNGIANFGANSLLEFDIRFFCNNDVSELLSYSFNNLPSGILTFQPSLPAVFYNSGVSHFSWISPTTYFGTMEITVSDIYYTTKCHINFDIALPVELTSFNSTVHGNCVNLNWSTSTETNNSGFDLERLFLQNGTTINNEWSLVNFVEGHGNSNTPNNYSYEDKNLSSGKYKYRLKQIDFNGNFEYFNLSNEVEIGVPDKFSLSQNYPNPFNPSTVISYQLTVNSYVLLKIYGISGKEIRTLVNENQNAGRYEVTFDGSKIASGVYFYKLEAGSYTALKKMFLLK